MSADTISTGEPRSTLRSSKVTSIPARMPRCRIRTDWYGDTGSKPGDYRWLLESDLLEATGPALVVVQMNPSTASETRSDSTVGKVEALG
jgi:hypothetical protein